MKPAELPGAVPLPALILTIGLADAARTQWRIATRRATEEKPQRHRQVGSWPACISRSGPISEPDDATRLPQLCRQPIPAAIISHAVWLYFRFPLSLRHVDEILAAAASRSATKPYGSGA